MQEESIKLDNQLLAIVQKQLDAYVPSANKTTGEPDHSLVVKLADEIARIETNLSKMDKSVRGYKQLVQAKDRMITMCVLMAMKSLVCSDRNITMVCNFKQDSFQTKVYQKASV